VSPSELEAAVATARAIAERAGAVVMQGFRGALTVQKKGGIDLVTDRDLASESLIRAELAAAFPDHGVVAEEGDGDVRARAKEWVWFCDPLDGTTNFASGHFFFAVSLGLSRGGVPIAGVVHAPALRTTWWGAEGLGASRATEGRAVERCAVSSRPESFRRGGERLIESLIATGFPYDRRTSPENNVREMSRIVVNVRGIRRCGSAALDLALVADGTYDGYWEQKLAPWDLCAGAALVKAAGGTLTDYEGREVSLAEGRVVATNGVIHAELLGEIAAARR
jgi:myo-inositol-1(or 4)-monophosphatase